MVERSGDRQRKFDGLKRWPFRLFIDGLSIMLQIALLLLACGLSRHVWAVDTSVASVVISFTVIGILFYIGIVAAGTSSYECPFQTPASTSLRYLRDSKTVQSSLASLVPSTVVLANLTPPNVASLIYATCMEVMRSPIVSSIRNTTIRVGDHTTILLLRIDRGLGNAQLRLVRGVRRFRHARTTTEGAHRQPPAPRTDVGVPGHRPITVLLRWVGRGSRNTKRRLAQGIRKFRAVLLPITVEGSHRQPLAPRGGSGLRVRVRNLAGLRKQNADNARCVSWVLRKLTDPEAVDPALRLAGTIRWFDSDVGIDPPFDLIVSTFEACFDSTKQLYPSMRDRAYFSARAILQISTGARGRSGGGASKYPVPAIPPSAPLQTDPDLHHALTMLKANAGPGRPTIDFPMAGENGHNHSLWMSNLSVDLTHKGPNPTLVSCSSYISASTTNHQSAIANILLVWYIFLGGYVEEETFWAVDKSYVVVLLQFLSLSPLNIIPKRFIGGHTFPLVHTSDECHH